MRKRQSRRWEWKATVKEHKIERKRDKEKGEGGGRGGGKRSYARDRFRKMRSGAKLDPLRSTKRQKEKTQKTSKYDKKERKEKEKEIENGITHGGLGYTERTT